MREEWFIMDSGVFRAALGSDFNNRRTCDFNCATAVSGDGPLREFNCPEFAAVEGPAAKEAVDYSA